MSAEDHYITELERDNRRLTESIETFRARCAELTAERDAAVDVALKNQFELARVKALESSMRETLTGIANATPKVFECPYEDFADEFLSWARSRARNELIARPNLNAKEK